MLVISDLVSDFTSFASLGMWNVRYYWGLMRVLVILVKIYSWYKLRINTLTSSTHPCDVKGCLTFARESLYSSLSLWRTKFRARLLGMAKEEWVWWLISDCEVSAPPQTPFRCQPCSSRCKISKTPSLNNSSVTKCNSVVGLTIYHSYKHFADIFLWKLINIIKKLISFRSGEGEDKFISPNWHEALA